MSSAVEKKNDDGDVQYITVEAEPVAKELGTDEIERIPETEPQKKIKPTLNERQEDTRGRVALIFVGGFFAILFVAAIISAFSEGNISDNLKENLLTVSGILSIPLGFVIGYYFRKQEEE